MGEQRETFDQVAGTYDKARTRPSDAFIDQLWSVLELSEGAAVVDVGAGTGQVTCPLAARGARVTAVEPGPALAALCEQNAAGLPVTMAHMKFEDFDGAHAFAAVVASVSAHWIERRAFLDRTVAALAPRGRVALTWNLDRSQDTAFWKATQPLYDRYIPDVASRPPRTLPEHAEAYRADLDADDRFETPVVDREPWTRIYDGATYLSLLETNSPVRMLSPDDRAAFLAGHEELLRKFDDRVERHYERILITSRLT